MQYRIELARDGMIDGGACSYTHWHTPTLTRNIALTSTHPETPTPTRTRTRLGAPPTTVMTSGDRLARLRALRKAWSTLSWTRCVTVPMPGPCCAYELVGGVFCKTQPAVRLSRGRGLGLAGVVGNASNGWLGVVGGHGYGDGFENAHGDGDGHGEEGEETDLLGLGSRAMSLTWLPGTHDRGHTDVRDDLGIPTRDFAMDPSQDLMVLFKGGEEVGLYVSLLFLCLEIMTTTTGRWWTSFLGCWSCIFGPCRRIRRIQKRGCRCCAPRCCIPSPAYQSRSSTTSWG